MDAPPDEEKAPSEELEVDLADLQDADDGGDALNGRQAPSLPQPVPPGQDPASLADRFRNLLNQSSRDGDATPGSGLSASHGSQQHGQVGLHVHMHLL